jgi:hypothetical protein
MVDANNSRTKNFELSIQVKCPFMHHHTKSFIQQILITMEHITQVGILGLIVPIVQIYLA